MNTINTALAICIGIAWVAYVLCSTILIVLGVFNQNFIVIGLLLLLATTCVTSNKKEG